MRKLFLSGVCVAGLAGLAQAQQAAPAEVNAQDVIVGRQAAYDLMDAEVKSMKAAVTAGADVKMFADGAKAISAWGQAIPGMFPPGTESGHDTKAKATIWSDNAGFRKAAAKLSTEADKLAQLAEADDKAGFASQFHVLGEACVACHHAYRNR